jgi:hypothetical protein
LSKKRSFDGVGHDARPLLGPDFAVVLESDKKQDDAGAGHGAEGLIAVGDVGGQDFGGAVSGARSTAHDTEGLVLCGKERNEVIGNDAACAEDGDHGALLNRCSVVQSVCVRRGSSGSQ